MRLFKRVFKAVWREVRQWRFRPHWPEPPVIQPVPDKPARTIPIIPPQIPRSCQVAIVNDSSTTLALFENGRFIAYLKPQGVWVFSPINEQRYWFAVAVSLQDVEWHNSHFSSQIDPTSLEAMLTVTYRKWEEEKVCGPEDFGHLYVRTIY
jgi:hypothetical protein